ncbi:HAD family hydrolase [Jeotgalibacillus proteolyticus]|uniref:HAD family hydrolase n=1 Tax=Jeotgalibacillus proteolyticus TaxID=2082395 RepID=A0A2S5GDS5_9BACL|nr:HAD family hydrolase [Jeotgalibacillus proteolyticus]
MKYVIFDFDGTLADSKQAMLTSWNAIARKYKYKELTFSDIEAMGRMSMRERSAMVNFPMYKIPIVIPQFYRLYKAALNKVEFFDGIKEMLQKIEEKGYKTVILSSNSKDNILTFLERNHVSGISEVICSSSIFGKDKLLNRFLMDHKLTPSEIIYAGDEQRDIIACKKAGVPVIWVSWGYDSIEVIEKLQPEFQAHSPEEILTII